MEITISVSEKTEKIIREKAAQNGKGISDFAGNLLEEKVKEDFPEIIEDESVRENKPHPLLKFAGMFSGGSGNVSENYKQILLDEVDPIAGFTTDKEK